MVRYRSEDVTSLMITTDALVADKPKKAEAPSTPPMDF